MTKEEYGQRKIKLEEEYAAKRADLAAEYALKNNPVKVGDIITDHYHTIQVKRIHIVMSSNQTGYPECVYDGIQLKKDLTPTKHQADIRMWQENITKHIPKP